MPLSYGRDVRRRGGLLHPPQEQSFCGRDWSFYLQMTLAPFFAEILPSNRRARMPTFRRDDVVAAASHSRARHEASDMTSQNDHQTGQSAHPAEALEISQETILRCARLIASGEIDWPSGLSSEQELTLTAEVRQFRRARLVRFIAAQIAADIARETSCQAREVPK